MSRETSEVLIYFVTFKEQHVEGETQQGRHDNRLQAM